MAQFKPFDYGESVGKGQRIRNARTRNALMDRELNSGNQYQNDQMFLAKQRNALLQDRNAREQTEFDQTQQKANTETLYRALTEISHNPAAADYHIPKLKEKGILRSDYDLKNMSMEEIQSKAAEGAQALGKSLGLNKSANQTGKYNPGDYTPKSWSEFMQGGGADPSMLVRYESPTVTKIGGVDYLVTRSGGSGTTIPLSTLDAETNAASRMAKAQEEAKLKAQLKGKPAIEREVILQKEASKKANESYDALDKITSNILNLTDALQLVKDGASTGPIMSILPSFRANAIALDSMQGRLGLDVVGAVTFGALSKGELDLAKSVALPAKLKGPDLIDWIETRISAQTKLSKYLEKQANFLSAGGTQAGWRKILKAKKDADKLSPAEEAERQRLKRKHNR